MAKGLDLAQLELLFKGMLEKPEASPDPNAPEEVVSKDTEEPKPLKKRDPHRSRITRLEPGSLATKAETLASGHPPIFQFNIVAATSSPSKLLRAQPQTEKLRDTYLQALK